MMQSPVSCFARQLTPSPQSGFLCRSGRGGNVPLDSEHFVRFYEMDEFLLDSVSGFIGAGLGAGAACIIFATKAHREGLEERLKANGLDLAAAFTQGTYLSLDPGETLSMFMVDGLPERFAEVVRSLIERAMKGRRRVRIFGEMVAQLWMQHSGTSCIVLPIRFRSSVPHIPQFRLTLLSMC
jgi:MEDS: MEthanogen/methylotroph, DcmR Sensory domain